MREKTRRRWLWRLFVISFIIFSICIIMFYWTLPWILEYGLFPHLAAKFKLPATHAHISQIGLSQSRFSDIAIGSDSQTAVTIDYSSCDYSLSSLWSNRLDSVTIEELKLPLIMSQNLHVTFQDSGLEKILNKESEAKENNERVTTTQADFQLLSLQIRKSLLLIRKGQDILSVPFELRAKKPFSFMRTVKSVVHQPRAELTLSTPTIKSNFSSQNSVFNSTNIIHPLPASPDITLRVTKNTSNNLKVALQTQWIDPEAWLRFFLEDTRRFHCSKLSTNLASEISLSPLRLFSLTGSCELHDVAWNNLNVKIVKTEFLPQMAASATPSSDFPHNTAQPNLLTKPIRLDIQCRRIEMESIEISNIETSLTIGNFNQLDLHDTRIGWLNGKIKIPRAHIDLAGNSFSCVIKCENLDIAQLLTQFGAGKVSGTGSVSGTLPIEYKNGKILFHDASLESPPGKTGLLRLHGGEILTTALPVDSPQRIQLEMANHALKDFTYESLKLTLNSTGDDVDLTLSVTGKPVKPIPFRYDHETSRYSRIKINSAGGLHRQMTFNTTFTFPMNKLLYYGRNLKQSLTGK